MLNTKKLLYIMPDSAYIAELLPTKKAHSFAIQAYRQINGNFIDENEFIAENVEKLIKKIDADEYHLILPDFLFTNTIVDVQQTSESGVKKYLKEELLPSLDLSKDSHEIDTFILTQHQGKSKVQLSALEKSLLVPLQKSCEEQKVKISHISPLSWTIKSVISLEPSLSTIQIGDMLYVAQHYIGIDQTISYSIEETSNIIETVKTLKGAEPNIQTMYLLTNALLENEIKEKLSGTLPIQQLANYAEEQEGMPSYIKQIIEAAAKTLDIPDHPVPRFSLGKYEGEAMPKSKTTQDTEKDELEHELPLPAVPAVAAPAVKPIELDIMDDDTEEEKESVKEKETSDSDAEPALPAPTLPPIPTAAPVSTPTLPTPEPELEKTVVEPEAPSAPEKEEEEEKVEAVQPFTATPFTTEKSDSETVTKPMEEVKRVEEAPKVEPLYNDNVFMPPTVQPTQPTPTLNTAASMTPARPIIKNKNDAGSLVKVIMITLGALLATVIVGGAIGFGLLRMSEGNQAALKHSPVVEASSGPEASVAPSPSPSPSANPSTVEKDTVKILIVNATTISGHAGKLKNTLTAAGYKNVDTGNAKGKYDEGTYVLTDSGAADLVAALEKDSKLSLTSEDGKSTEDTKDAYDAVIVLAE